MNVIAETLKTLGLEDTPEKRLALKITWASIEALKCGDTNWLHALADEMERERGLENLERLQQLYDWVLEHPPKPKSNRG